MLSQNIQSMNRISAVIITFNEEKNIGRCIDSLSGIADEIVVVDSMSTDKTSQICLEAGVSFHPMEWKGYSGQKNYGNELAKFDWILSIDADEQLSEELRTSILQWKKLEKPDFASFNRLTAFCGKWIRHSGWYPDTKTRIFDRRRAQWQGEIHEQLVFEPAIEVMHLNGDLLHYSVDSLSQQIRVIDKYSELAAEKMFAEGRKVSYLRIIFSPAFKFIRDYFFKRGFLDGYHGFLIAANSSYSVFLKYARLKFKYEQQKYTPHD
jgi:glycosyltransferase involved in cell wall biosynthesis